MRAYKQGDGPTPWFKIIKYEYHYYEPDVPAGLLIGRVFIPRTGFWAAYGVLASLMMILGASAVTWVPEVAAVAGVVLTLQVLCAALFWGILGLVKLFRSWAALSRSVYEREKGGRR